MKTKPIVKRVKKNISPYKIEKGIPVPPSKTEKRSAYPIRFLEVGQSFFVPLQCRTRKQLQLLSTRTQSEMKRHKLPHRFTVRYFPELKGTRVWRVK